MHVWRIYQFWYKKSKCIKNWEKSSLNLPLGICFQTPLSSKYVYENGAKDTPVIHHVILFSTAAVNIYPPIIWVVREGGLQLSGCLAAIQLLGYLCVSESGADVPAGQLHLRTRCMKVLVHPVATPLSWDPRVTPSYLLTVWPSCPHGILVCQIIGGYIGQLASYSMSKLKQLLY